ncbi:SDR family oxidoreductase [Kribbella sandramycini]|uniref:NAD(P)-dependent dehydrogenase (Short-subunit alcohol dehydrogenase family) n=1 Tax=Kribbella sandramycini TaxID=60450 RepID=A0A7Y4KW38_9ACTN|nr:SDR family oxidoreductase [Kribbella sandramycini]MBB6567624.1 NAD(P)-dependent dehydrogenase (short-subunit alcohol dehydrogenase family) [Kribbella sandramycini]NOL39773.1 SDR family oxidoreductase [Kribbella sandramycini]
MELHGAVAVVTGSNRGLGRELARQLVERGAKVYGGARRPETVDLPGVVPLQLDVTDPESIQQAARTASDATLLINNAGVSTHTALVAGDWDNIKLELDTHLVGPLLLTRAFAPVIEANGGGAIHNVASVLSWVHNLEAYAAYSVAKAAEWAMTRNVHAELKPRGIEVSSLHVGYMDTDMADYVPADQKTDPAAVAKYALDGIAAGDAEIVVDDFTRGVRDSIFK